MKNFSVDLNSDVGESFGRLQKGNDAAIIPLLSSCNVACGYHGGDRQTIRTAVKLAHQHQVKIGAHPSYPDRRNFGRRAMDLDPNHLRVHLMNQMNMFDQHVRAIDAEWNHIKLHGALYSDANHSLGIAELLLSVISDLDRQLILYVPYGSPLAKMALAQNMKVKFEGFADRNYYNLSRLVARKYKNALIQHPTQAANQVLKMIKEQLITLADGLEKKIKVDTICVHSDHPTALELLQFLRLTLHQHDITIE